MGYDYYGSFSKTTGPVTPFTNSPQFGKGLQSSVQYYLDKGVRRDKLIVGLPYYGAEWYTSTDVIGSQVDRFRSHPPYSAIRKYYLDSMGLSAKFDTASQSSYLILEDPTHFYRQLFLKVIAPFPLSSNGSRTRALPVPGCGLWGMMKDILNYGMYL